MPSAEHGPIANARLMLCGGLLTGLLFPGAHTFPPEAAQLHQDRGWHATRADVHPMRSCLANEADIETAFRGEGLDAAMEPITEPQPPDTVFMLGYSKDTPDILPFLVNRPDHHHRIKGVVSWAGAVGGSYTADGIYDQIKDFPGAGSYEYDVNNDMQLTQRQALLPVAMNTHLAMAHAHQWDIAYAAFPLAMRVMNPNLDNRWPRYAALVAMSELLAEFGLIDGIRYFGATREGDRMKRLFALTAAALATLGFTAPAAQADPTPVPNPEPGYNATTYLIGKCWDPGMPVEQEPARLQYNCDGTSSMEDMTWTAWDADGANGTGTDNSVECQPNCAQGPRLFNPIVVRAWNPQPVNGCPPDLQFYTDLTVAYPQGVPPWVKPGTRWSPDTYFTTVDGMPAVHFTNQGAYSCTPLTR